MIILPLINTVFPSLNQIYLMLLVESKGGQGAVKSLQIFLLWETFDCLECLDIYWDGGLKLFPPFLRPISEYWYYYYCCWSVQCGYQFEASRASCQSASDASTSGHVRQARSGGGVRTVRRRSISQSDRAAGLGSRERTVFFVPAARNRTRLTSRKAEGIFRRSVLHHDAILLVRGSLSCVAGGISKLRTDVQYVLLVRYYYWCVESERDPFDRSTPHCSSADTVLRQCSEYDYEDHRPRLT
jgi:hypothetical protein